MQEIDAFDKKASVISNGLGKHMTFRIDKKISLRALNL